MICNFVNVQEIVSDNNKQHVQKRGDDGLEEVGARVDAANRNHNQAIFKQAQYDIFVASLNY